MRRISNTAFAVAVLAGLAGTQQEAVAQTNPVLSCAVSTSGTPNYTVGHCGTNTASFNYVISFSVGGGSGSYSYAWTLPGGRTPCANTASVCSFSITHGAADAEETASVVITNLSTGGQTSSSATYFIPAVCAHTTGGHTPYFC